MRPLKHKAATAADTNSTVLDVAGGRGGDDSAVSSQGAAAAVATSAAAPQHEDNTSALLQRVAEAERAQQLVQQQLAQMQQQQAPQQQISPAKLLFLDEHPGADLNRLGNLHNKAVGELKLADDSPEYFRFLKAAIQPQQVDEPIAPQRAPAPEPPAPMARVVEAEPVHEVQTGPPPPERSFVVSAPTSREAMSIGTGRAMSASNKIRLSPEQVEAAKIAGVSLEVYARGVQQLARDKLLNPDKYGTR